MFIQLFIFFSNFNSFSFYSIFFEDFFFFFNNYYSNIEVFGHFLYNYYFIAVFFIAIYLLVVVLVIMLVVFFNIYIKDFVFEKNNPSFFMDLKKNLKKNKFK